MKDKVIRLCQLITNSTPDTTINGEIESLALEIETELKLPDAPVNWGKHLQDILKSEYLVKTIVFPAWQSAANAFRLYPDRKHTFEQYWEGNKDYLMSLYKTIL